jgi:hypothetical protein
MTERKLPPVNRPSLGERLPVRAVVAIVAVLVLVIAGAAVLVRGSQAPAPTPTPVLSGSSPTPAVSVTPTPPPNDYADPVTVTASFYHAFERTRSHPQDLSDVMQYMLPGSFGAARIGSYFDQIYVQKTRAFIASDSTIGNCTVADGPLWTRQPGTQTPRADLALKHVTCKTSDTGQDTDLSGNPVGTHDPVWHDIFSTEVQQYNGLWYVFDWGAKKDA